MPNHCSNRLTVSGSPKDLADFGTEARGIGPDGKPDNNSFSINSFFPEPDELKGIECGGTTINGIKYTSWRTIKKADGTEEDSGIGKEETEVLMKKYGACNLYDWHCHYFGTKWGTYDCSMQFDRKSGNLIYHYQTAWSPLSDSIMEQLSEMFPRLTFRMEYAECGAGYHGMRVYCKGEVTDQLDGSSEGYFVDGECVVDDEFADLYSTSG